MHKCQTVGDLKKALEEFTDDTLLCSTGPDGGGYDAEFKEEVVVYPYAVGLYVGGVDSSSKDEKLSYEI